LLVERFASDKFLRAWLLLVFCWAHGRRDFLLARAGAAAAQAAWADGWVERIGQLYHLTETRLALGQAQPGAPLPPPFVRLDPGRQATPEDQPAEAVWRPAVAALAAQREAELAEPRRPAPRRKILESLRAHWEGLTPFWAHPEWPLDNHGAARAARPVALGRKNYYGCGAPWSVPLWAMRLTLLQTLAVHRVDARAYLQAYLLSGAPGRYLLRSGAPVLGALGFGAAAWSVGDRDRFLGWPPQRREQNLHWIVNNSRFLLLPWVRSPNLAAWVLAQAARQLPKDWLPRYGYRPVLLETFVEQDRFQATAYKAANWACVGVTKGRGKLEKTHRRVVPVKWIFVYPLAPNFKAILNP
jgi:hypothetical protein